ncbi:MAG: helix-turn-helix transcriptional regulator [Clostridiales bacterium]|nr:helix-turn-helix transcriptional regulator [Clostridiales bacterium]
MVFSRLKDLREDADKHQSDIAELLHCQREVYRRYETGVSELPVWALIVLAQYYHTSTDYILGLTNERRPYPPALKLD